MSSNSETVKQVKAIITHENHSYLLTNDEAMGRPCPFKFFTAFNAPVADSVIGYCDGDICPFWRWAVEIEPEQGEDPGRWRLGFCGGGGLYPSPIKLEE